MLALADNLFAGRAGGGLPVVFDLKAALPEGIADLAL